jgi:hypothetical protein
MRRGNWADCTTGNTACLARTSVATIRRINCLTQKKISLKRSFEGKDELTEKIMSRK